MGLDCIDAGLGRVLLGDFGFVAVGTGSGGCSRTDPPEVVGPLVSLSGMFMSDMWSDSADE
jgi:hypothetical protein